MYDCSYDSTFGFTVVFYEFVFFEVTIVFFMKRIYF